MEIQEENEQFLQIDVVKKIFSEHDIHWDETSREWQFDFSVPGVEVNYFLGAWKVWQAAKASVPEGFVLMPKEPTLKLSVAYEQNSIAPISSLSVSGYRAMIEAQEPSND